MGTRGDLIIEGLKKEERGRQKKGGKNERGSGKKIKRLKRKKRIY